MYYMCLFLYRRNLSAMGGLRATIVSVCSVAGVNKLGKLDGVRV